MSGRPPLLWLIIGPNGAGKSTYYATRVAPRLAAEFVNADVIARDRWPHDEQRRSYEAAKLAATRRQRLLEQGQSFVTETVASHPSKLDLLQSARKAGYEVWVTFAYLASADLAVARVAERVRRGGHPVPEDKVRGRYERMAPLAVQAVEASHRAFVIDNSDPRAPLRDVLLFERGRLVWKANPLPAWTIRLFQAHLG